MLDKTGQFCGNHNSNPWVTHVLGWTHAQEWLDKMRFGPPKATRYVSSEEMLTWGWVGMYLKEDCDLSEIDEYWPIVKWCLERFCV